MGEYNLEKRTKFFSRCLLKTLKNIKLDYYNKSIISQLVRSGTSIGANYCEAINASSRKDFRNKIFICKKEAEETKYWLELLAETNKEKKDDLKKLWLEVQELLKIFQKSITTLNNNIN